MTVHDVVVVGGGPGGLTAALVLARARRDVLLVDDRTYRNKAVTEFHGFPGRDGSSPARLRVDVRGELERYGVEVVPGPAFAAHRGADGEPLLSLPDRQVRAAAVVLATGVHDELPPIEGLRTRWGRSVFSCPFCDGWEHRDRPVAVIDATGAADHLVETLAAWTSDITVLRTDEIRCLAGAGDGLERIELHDGTAVAVEAAFVSAPIRPRSALAVALGCRTDDHGYIVTDQLGATSQADVWAVGDVRRPPPLPHQAVLAAADGSAAAIDLHRTLIRRGAPAAV